MLSDKTLSVIVSLLQQQKNMCKSRMMASIEDRLPDMMVNIEKYQQAADAVEDFDAFLDELGANDEATDD